MSDHFQKQQFSLFSGKETGKFDGPNIDGIKGQIHLNTFQNARRCIP
jgi:hypothetical protein